jgi:TATA-box binding protein (TBP) (component of TFIID and TFIIIB)
MNIFPEIVHRIDNLKLAMLLFGSGKIVRTGVKKTE